MVPPDVPTMLFKRSLEDHVMGKLVNKRRATRDHEAGNECPKQEP